MSAPSLSAVGVVVNNTPREKDSIVADGGIPGNVVAINHDLSLRLAQAPNDLRESYIRDGYGGAVRFNLRWAELIETVLRVHAFRLLLASTRGRALGACDAIMRLRIPVDDIWVETMRLRKVLDPNGVYNDRPVH